MTEISKTLDQGLTLLDEVGANGAGTVADLAARCGLNRTVAHRLVNTLVGRGFLRRDENGQVALGPALMVLGEQVETSLRGAAQIPLRVLSGKLKETAVITVAEDGEAVALDQFAHMHLLRVDYRPGFRHPLDQAAHGKAILAFRDDEDSGPRLDPEERTRIRRRGYADSQGELQQGAAGLAAPVFGPDGRVVASIGIVAPADRMPDRRVAARAVLEAAAAVSRNLGFESPRRSDAHGAC